MADIFGLRFLLASLHIEAILRGTTVSQRRKVLKSIKGGAGLGDVYDATLHMIKAQDEEKEKLAMAALTWACHSDRPLQVDELCHALAVEIGETDFDSENVPSIGALLDYCQGLITVDEQASTVRLIHYTVQEYLCGHRGFFRKPHSILAETCLTYLNSRQIKNLTPHSLPDFQSIPFLKYSSRYWGAHVNKDLSDHAKALALELFNKYEDHISAVSLLEQIVDPGFIGSIATSLLFSALHCASFFGIVELVTVLVNSGGYNINQQDGTGSTPLSWAARNGHGGVVKLLLELENIDPYGPDEYDRTPLGWAAIVGHEGVVKLLLEREDVDTDHPDISGNGPLGCAAICGHEGVVKILLEHPDVDPNLPNQNDQTPLLSAAVNGHEGVVRLLLEWENVDCNRPDKSGNGPLGCAAIEGHEGVVKILLEQQDIDPNHTNINGRTPLGCAAVEGHEGVVGLLLERGDVDPNRPDKNGNGPLGSAATEGYEGVVKILLENQGIDPNLPNKNGRTPLGCAAGNSHEGVVKLLRERESVDRNRPDENGNRPPGCAVIEGHEGVVKVPLEYQDVDPNLPNKNDKTPLGCAAGNGHEGVVELLHRGSVDPNRPDINGNRPLGCAVEGRVVKMPLEPQDIDPDCSDNVDRTPLLNTAVHGHEGVVKPPQQRGRVGRNLPATDTGTPLPDAASEGPQVLQTQAPNSVKTPLAQARKEGRWHIWKRRLLCFKQKKA